MASDAGPSSAEGAPPSAPVACVVIGMAGAGKTTLLQRLNAHLHEAKTPYYLINLDPAVLETPFGANIDIRDTVNYREVMKQYQLGPNGGILTALNLFATRFEQVLGLVEKRRGEQAKKEDPLKYVVLDTPGQIEIFTWSASGQIIAESLASTMPTCVVYVVDTPRCQNAVTFMSNMLYACSILYKMKLPLIVVFNKTDVAPHDTCVSWMEDFEAFQQALQQEKSYMGSLAQSMALMLEEFYKSLTAVGVSALTGEGMEEFFHAVDAAAQEYERTYAVELRERRQKMQEEKATHAAAEAKKYEADRATEAPGASGASSGGGSGSGSGSTVGAKVVLDGSAGGSCDGAVDDEVGPLFRSPHEGDPEEDEYEHAGFTAADEAYNRELRDEDEKEYASLQLFLQQQRQKRAGKDAAADGGK